MLKWMLRKTKSHSPDPLSPVEPFYAIGDVHGCHTLLLKLLETISNFDGTLPEIRRPSALVFVGDYIDKGENSSAVIDYLMAIQAEATSDHVICLKGNHEAICLDFLEQPAEIGNFWMQVGGDSTLVSFGIRPPPPNAPPEAWITARDELSKNLGRARIEWLRSLPTSWRTGNIGFVHAGADPLVPIDLQSDETLLWGHPKFLKENRIDGYWIVYGHTIQEGIIKENSRIGIDTGAFATGRLSGIYVDSADLKVFST